MPLPDWLADRIVEGDCKHDFSKEVAVDPKDLPPYVTTAAPDRYCSKCGEKETLRHRIALAAPQPVQDAPYAPPPVARGNRHTLPSPVPLDQIHVTLQLEKFGKRYDKDREAGIKDRAINVGSDPRMTDAMAAAAEEYVALALGLQLSGSMDKPDKGWDMTFQGRRVQVKWTKYEDGKLIASPTQTINADYYVLVTGDAVDDFRIAGWATAKELKSSTRDLGYGITFALSQSQLRPFESLLAIRFAGA